MLSKVQALALPIPTRKPDIAVRTAITQSITFFQFILSILSQVFNFKIVLYKITYNRLKPAFEVIITA